MNALKLLFCGNSLAPGQDVVGRFRMREDQLLPRFGGDLAGKPTAADPSVGRSLWTRLRRIFSGGGINLKSSAGDGLFTTSAVNDNVAGMVDAALAQSPEAEQVEIARKPNFFRTQPRDAKVVQAEFRFGKVKVVCNDLHDADFEIVSAPQKRNVAPVSALSREPAHV